MPYKLEYTILITLSIFCMLEFIQLQELKKKQASKFELLCFWVPQMLCQHPMSLYSNRKYYQTVHNLEDNLKLWLVGIYHILKIGKATCWWVLRLYWPYHSMVVGTIHVDHTTTDTESHANISSHWHHVFKAIFIYFGFSNFEQDLKTSFCLNLA